MNFSPLVLKFWIFVYGPPFTLPPLEGTEILKLLQRYNGVALSIWLKPHNGEKSMPVRHERMIAGRSIYGEGGSMLLKSPDRSRHYSLVIPRMNYPQY